MTTRSRFFSQFAKSVNPETGSLVNAALPSDAVSLGDLSGSGDISYDSATGQISFNNSSGYISQDTETVTLLQQGELQVITGSARWYAPQAITVSKITARVSTAPTGSGLTILVKKSGSTASTLTIADAGTSAVDNTGFSMTANDFLTVDISAIGSTTPGEELNLQFIYTLD